MPHVEIKYSNDIKLNYDALFDSVEATINKLDSSAGACKSRAYPTVKSKGSVEISLTSFINFSSQLFDKITGEEPALRK